MSILARYISYPLQDFFTHEVSCYPLTLLTIHPIKCVGILKTYLVQTISHTLLESFMHQKNRCSQLESDIRTLISNLKANQSQLVGGWHLNLNVELHLNLGLSEVRGEFLNKLVF